MANVEYNVKIEHDHLLHDINITIGTNQMY